MYGISIKSDFLQKYYLEKRIPLARKIITQFPILDQIFKNFKDYEKKQVRGARNFIFHIASPKIGEQIDTPSIDWLKSIEETLSIFKFEEWSTRKKDGFLPRLKSDDYYESISPSSELMLARIMVTRFGKENVELWPDLDNGGESDVKVKFGRREVYIEVGNLSLSLPEKKIQKILDDSAAKIIETLDRGYNHLTVVSSEFEFDENGYINVEKSVEKICGEVERLKLGNLVNYTGGINFSQLAYVVENEELLMHLEPLVLRYEDEFNIINTEPGKSWVVSCRDELIKGSNLLTGFIRSNSNNNVVEVHTEGFYPKTASLAEQNSFIRHVKSHIDGQLHQMQPSKCNIIYVQGDNWTLFGIMDILGRNPLYREVKKYLEDKGISELNGVVIVRSDFNKPVFVYNESCDQTICFPHDQLSQLGFDVIV
jgi:hypothetical protein